VVYEISGVWPGNVVDHPILSKKLRFKETAVRVVVKARLFRRCLQYPAVTSRTMSDPQWTWRLTETGISATTTAARAPTAADISLPLIAVLPSHSLLPVRRRTSRSGSGTRYTVLEKPFEDTSQGQDATMD
jgi:hypothetical protein